MKRRSFIATSLSMAVAALGAQRLFATDKGLSAPKNDNWQLSEEEWKQRLTSEQFAILRKEGTERPGSSPLNREKRSGEYRCAGCDLPLFTSAMKYDSGTGWPSFFRVIDGNIGTKQDYKLFRPRTEYHCIRCGGHQGHVFNDGPQPTGKRWCNNGLALRFVPDVAKA